jgi:hypothetical protein
MTEYCETFSNRFIAAGRRLVDDIIEPAEARLRPLSTARSKPQWAKEIARPWPGTRQLLLVRFSVLAYRFVAFRHGGSSFQRIWQSDSFRTGLNRRSTFNSG